LTRANPSKKKQLPASKRNAPNPDSRTVSISFDGNNHLHAVFGSHDEHLALIENKLRVEITARGNRVSIHGEAANTERARKALVELYGRATKGIEITRGDVDGAVRMTEIRGIQGDAGPANGEIRTRRKQVTARTPMQRKYIEAIRRFELVFGIGPAGTGKTYLAVACAAEALMNGEVDRIILSRPAVEAGERLGFLPGDMKEKIDPYLRPLYDALYDMMPQSLVAKGLAENQIEIAPLAFMRGRTLSSAFIILDEAQNTTPQQMKMFLTRLGEGSRMVVTGDPTQVDLPHQQKSGLQDALTILKSVKGISHIHFTQSDIVRHALVGRIVQAYEKVKPATKPKNTD
jgi:phosphate starvation-inducible protein PhoH and related proteins